MIRRLAAVALMGGLWPGVLPAQTPPTPGAAPANPVATAAPAQMPGQPRGYRDPLPTNPADPNYHAGAYHSIVRHNPVPSRTAYRPQGSHAEGYRSEGYRSEGQASQIPVDRSGGFYSTGGVGRNAEYYDSRTLDQAPNAHQVPVARFDNGGGPDRNEQLAARQVGTQRSQAIQSTINTFGTPYAAFGAGYGYGLGLGGGRLYSFPY